MADEEKNEEVEVSDTSAASAPEATPEEVSDTSGEPVAEADDQADASTEGPAKAPEADAEPAVDAEPEMPAKPARSRRHVPRSQRRVRPRPKREPAAKRKPITRTPTPEHERGRRQERRGVVVSDAGDKTIVVKVDVIKSHPRYKKVVRRSVKFHAHDEQNTAGIGDTVRIVETRPLSKQKHWRLAEIVEKAR